MTDPRELAKTRRRRGVAKASITPMFNELESESDCPSTFDMQMLVKLKEHDADFKKNHLMLIDLVDDEETLTSEQAALDEHDDLVANLTGTS